MLDRVGHLPRYHLGSTLYQTKITQESSDSEEEGSKFGYTTTSLPIRRFDEKENCTFTVRVPRIYLQNESREQICERRALWGAEIYTDDSDPIAAAIHGGWIRGEWDTETMKGLQSDLGDAGAATAKATEMSKSKEPVITMMEPPSVPIYPIPKRDLHITLLILPRLQAYASHVAFGMKSREWKTTHDGMSFKVEKIAWVDEKTSMGEERGGEARRKRLKAMMDSCRDIGFGPKLSTTFASENPQKVQPAEVVA